jgi:signal transduction histidine kinase
VSWAGDPYQKLIRESTGGPLEPRKSFKALNETIVGKCHEWSEEDRDTAAFLCLVYGRFTEVWRQEQAALQNNQLTRLRLANAAHKVRTPLNAIIIYLESATKSTLDQETRHSLSESHSASKSLIYVVNDLLDSTGIEEGGELLKDEVFDVGNVLREATEMFARYTRRKKITCSVAEHTGLPSQVAGNARRVKQTVSNVIVNAIENTSEGGVSVETTVTSYEGYHVEIEGCVSDTGTGMTSEKLDALSWELKQVQLGEGNLMEGDLDPEKALTESRKPVDVRVLGLGLFF